MADVKNSKQELVKLMKEFLRIAPDLYLPAISIDPVVFSYHNGKLNVLVVRFAGSSGFGLPGGFVKKNEDIDAAALRILQEMTGINNIYLEQFYTSGKVSRYDKKVIRNLFIKRGLELPANNWMEQRFVSVCYYALVDAEKVMLKSMPFIEAFKWMDVKKLPRLSYDHNDIIGKAVSRLQSDLDNKLVEFKLMDETFTMKDLQKLYEIVYQRKMVRTNFQRRILNLGVLERLDKKYNGKSHKAPYLYRFARAK